MNRNRKSILVLLAIIVVLIVVYVFFFRGKDDGFITRETHVAYVRESTQPETIDKASVDVPTELNFINEAGNPLLSYMEIEGKNEDVNQSEFSYQIATSNKDSESSELQARLESLHYTVTTQDFEDGGELFYGVRAGESVIISISPDQENPDMMLVTVTYENKS